MHTFQVWTIKLFTNAGFAFCDAAPLRRLLRHVMVKVGGAGRKLTFYYTSTSECYWTYHSRDI